MSLYLILSSLLTTAAYAGEPLAFENVVSAEDQSADALYGKARLWVADSFRSAQDVVQLDDPQTHTVVLKAVSPYSRGVFFGGGSINGYVRYTLKIECRDGRYKYRLYDFTHDATLTQGPEIDFGLITTEATPPKVGGTGQWRQKVWDDLKREVQTIAQPLTVSLEGMATSAAPSDEDW